MSPPTESEVEQARKVILAHARDVVRPHLINHPSNLTDLQVINR
jgi:hypothetical protein